MEREMSVKEAQKELRTLNEKHIIIEQLMYRLCPGYNKALFKRF